MGVEIYNVIFFQTMYINDAVMIEKKILNNVYKLNGCMTASMMLIRHKTPKNAAVMP